MTVHVDDTHVVRSRSDANVAFWNNPAIRAILYQVIVVAAVVLLAAYLVNNTMHNLAERSIASGFGFLDNEAGFAIGETPIAYAPADSYGRAFIVGILNTVRVSIIGIVLATIIGTIIGIARLSANWLVARLAAVYVETTRNIPLLLQLFFWYVITHEMFPGPRQALNPVPGLYLTNRGILFGMPIWTTWYLAVLVAFAVGIGLSFWWYRRVHEIQDSTGEHKPVLWPVLGFIIGLPALVWLVGGAPLTWNVPVLKGFNFQGGGAITPEFTALLLGLTFYTASFIAEIVRSGIQAVAHGQSEAAGALGLRKGLALRLVILPQALRIIVPPTTSQYLNVVKNSSLAVAIGYPDLVSVSNTSLNQTGQAIECIAIIMAVYLTISLSISAFMNWYNKAIALVER